MIKKATQVKDSGERGQSLVEFAVSLVLLLMLLSVIVDTSRALFTYLSMRDAAQEGAIFASFQPSNSAGIRARICASSNMISDLCNTNSLAITSTPTVPGQYCLGTTGSVMHGMVIKLQYPNFPLTMPFVGAFINKQTISITAQISDAILAPLCK